MLSDTMTKMNRSSRYAFLAGLVLIAAFGLYKWIFSPFSGQLFAAQQCETIVESTVRKTRIAATALEAGGEKSGRQREQIRQLQGQLFTPGELNDLLSTIQHAATQAGCTINSFSFAADQDVNPADLLPDTVVIVPKRATLSITGGYDGIMQLLDSMRSYPRKIWIGPFKLYAPDGNFSRLRCDVSITIYSAMGLETILYD